MLVVNHSIMERLEVIAYREAASRRSLSASVFGVICTALVNQCVFNHYSNASSLRSSHNLILDSACQQIIVVGVPDQAGERAVLSTIGI
jgi:hypothetical protein